MILDKKTITLKKGKEKVEVLVCLKEVNARNNSRQVRGFCRILGKL